MGLKSNEKARSRIKEVGGSFLRPLLNTVRGLTTAKQQDVSLSRLCRRSVMGEVPGLKTFQL